MAYFTYISGGPGATVEVWVSKSSLKKYTNPSIYPPNSHDQDKHLDVLVHHHLLASSECALLHHQMLIFSLVSFLWKQILGFTCQLCINCYIIVFFQLSAQIVKIESFNRSVLKHLRHLVDLAALLRNGSVWNPNDIWPWHPLKVLNVTVTHSLIKH